MSWCVCLVMDCWWTGDQCRVDLRFSSSYWWDWLQHQSWPCRRTDDCFTNTKTIISARSCGVHARSKYQQTHTQTCLLKFQGPRTNRSPKKLKIAPSRGPKTEKRPKLMFRRSHNSKKKNKKLKIHQTARPDEWVTCVKFGGPRSKSPPRNATQVMPCMYRVTGCMEEGGRRCSCRQPAGQGQQWAGAPQKDPARRGRRLPDTEEGRLKEQTQPWRDKAVLSERTVIACVLDTGEHHSQCFVLSVIAQPPALAN